MSQSVLVIKAQVNAEFAEQFNRAGFSLIVAPVMTIHPLFYPPAYVQHCLANSDIIICLSQNAVKQLYYYQGQLNHQAEVWAVGKQTANKLACYLGEVNSPALETSEGLWQCLREKISSGTRITFIKGAGGRDSLMNYLTQKGARLTQLNLYQRLENTSQRAQILKSIEVNQANTAIIGSKDLLDIAITWWPDSLPLKQIIVPSERVALRAQQLGLNRVTVAEGATADRYLAVLQDRKSA
ncbi:uroporphyrinogen-III synthase [Planctobacterium marinum]|uniref:Uroporphyrinogen-III synthase n=1 Tax=Planctobacterium marinum TaxID=1631968 RepID=A0AA48HJ93_9ALTE|nr:hypothetical protein MACH26_01330 [Planctobacterium marinum]